MIQVASRLAQKDDVLYTNHLTQAFNLFSLLTVVGEIVWGGNCFKVMPAKFYPLTTSIKKAQSSQFQLSARLPCKCLRFLPERKS